MSPPGGARVKLITAESAAADADLSPGDVIIRFDGVRITDDSHLINQVKLTPVGATVEIVVLRAGERVSLKVKMRARSE